MDTALIGADINKIDELSEKWDLTALIAASAENNLDAVKLLVENGADLNIGRTRKCKVDKAGSLDKGTALDFTEPCLVDLRDLRYGIDCLTSETYEYLQKKGALPSLPQSCPENRLGIR